MFKDYIDNDKVWLEFLQSRLDTNYDTLEEKKILKEFIENKKYKEITTKLKNNNYTFSIPRKKEINKNRRCFLHRLFFIVRIKMLNFSFQMYMVDT